MGTRKLFIFSAAAFFVLFHSAFSQPASRSLASRTFTDYALQFDGVDDFVEIKDINNSLDLNDFTLEAWIIRLEENSTGVIIHKGAGGEDPSVNTNFALFYRGDKFAHVLWEHPDSRNFEVIGTTTLELNQWYHIAGVRSAADNLLKLYVNGVLDAPVVYTDGKPNTQNVPTRLGLNDFGFSSDEYMKGVIDEARIWKIPRSQAEIQAAMHQQLTGQESGLVGYWKLDEGEGQLVHDASPFSNNGTLGLTQAVEPSDPLWLLASPRPPHSTNYALLYDGTDDLVWIPDQNNSLDLTDFTIECWVQIASGGKIQELVVKDAEGEDPSVNSNYSFDVWSDQKLRIVFENANQDNQEIFGNTVLEVGKLYHVAASFNFQTKALSLFVNGKLDAGPTVVVGTPNHQNQPLRLGTGYEGGPRTTTHGVIDEVRIWKIARGESDIHATMNKLLQGNENGLVGYWRFDEGSGQIIHDRSSFQNHGKRGFSDASETFDPAWVLSPWQPPNPNDEDFALQFDGTDDLVQINDVNGSLDLNDFTLEAWVWRMEENKTEEIIHKGGVGENPSVNTNYAILFREDNLARAHFEYADSRNVEAVGTTPIQTNRWYHMAGVRSSADNSLKIYVNGVLDAPPLKTELPPNQQDSPVRLGANDPGWNIDENFKGILDEVRIWKVARTQEQIQATMHAQLSGQEQGLAAYWRLNEGAGQAANDRTSFGNHGILGLSFNVEAQDPIWVKPPALPSDSSNFALDFDGLDDHVLFEPNLLDTPQQITMEAWVKYQSTKTYMMAVSLEGVYAFFLNRFSVGTFTPFFDGGSIHANDHAYGANLNDGQWHHLAAVNNGQTLQVFVDGVFTGSVNETLYDITSLNRTSALGAQFDASEFHFDGVIDEVRVWNLARTPEQIQAHMHERLLGNETGLVAYWRLDEGAGQVINDGAIHPHPGHRGSSENPDAADPAWVLANRTPATGCIGIPLPAGEAYGNINQNRQTHSDKITYCFEEPTGDRYLSFAVYDVDQIDEVSLSLNGEMLMFAPITANNTWSSLVGVLLSDAQIHNGQANTLVFDNTRNPPQNWRWGARQVSVDPFYALPSPAAYGNITGGDTQHADKVVYFFSGRGGDLNLAYQVFDIDHLDEVDIVLNDTKVKDETLTSNETWSESRSLLLPDELVHNTGVNVLIFENTKNPPRNWRWGVRDVSVNVATTSSLALAGQTNASMNGQGVLNGRYLMDGQLTPLLREHGDQGGADSSRYVIQGATTIAANGHALIELPSAQKIDYLTLYPEWHAARYFSYRLETSTDGRNWNTAVDKMNVKLHGTQIERVAQAGVRYLRLSGFSVVVDPDSSLLNGLSEAAYWQSYTSLLQQAQPEALAIAELVLLKQEGNVKVDEPVAEVPAQYRLEQNLPNPFSANGTFGNPSTIIRFDLPQAERVFLAIYNLRGELVATLVDGNLPSGSHAFTFDASGLATGVYFYRVSTERFAATKKMLLAK